MKNLPFLAQRLFNTPLAITPAKAELVMAALADRFGITKLFRANGDAVALSEFGFSESDDEVPDRYYDVVAGVAVIPINGTLVQKSGYMRPTCGMTGYDGIRANLSMALEDDGVRAIMLDIDSGGGEVAGCFDLVDAIYGARGRKPIWAVLSESAYSAAYAIASAADKIIVPRTGGTGSVGVICAHVDFSKALAKEGITVTMIHYGARKADGSEYAPLSDDALARFQADVDEMGELFVKTVARNRNMSAAKVRGTQATTFLGAAGVEIGFADAVMAPDEAFRSLLAELG
ncbi:MULTISPECIES: S49 family peptidase [Ralstonia]|jgi:signal peptide peptidase SppA|uniref:Protein C n=1 Tax=Ralstonia pickettii OR214 TaxID=1264675 RepID=R0CSU8_RALPI|nr:MULTISPECIES: S49 family peptidase [Ralstonia]ENZ79621.1 protein C [Ralstonia pickettii OR214]MBL4778416.1 S49 family peptidase [Ralstonia sp.]MCM3582155.1 S49 family peptidase [Ralstonia pickettii]